MQGQLRQAALVAFGVFVVAVVVSLATSGTASDVAFFVYVVALIVLVGLVIALLVGRGREPGPPPGQPQPTAA